MSEAAFRSWAEASGTKIPPELEPIVIQEYPEVVAAGAVNDAPVTVQRPLPISGPRLQHHAFYRLFLGWSKDFSFETFTGVVAIGPFGCRRIDGRPEALAAILLVEHAALPTDTADGYAEIFWHALSPLEEPDRDANPARSGRHNILTAFALDKIATGGPGIPLPVDPQAFAKIRAEIAAPTFASGVLGFASVDFVEMNGKDAVYAVTRWTCRVHPSSYAIVHETVEVGRYVGNVGHYPVVGRPLMVDDAPRVAPLVRRADWM